jgi:hypothetical protein
MTPTRHSQSQQPTLKAFLDRELLPWQQLAVRLHLARCVSCREDLQAMRQIGDKLRGQEIDPLDPKLRTRILASVQEMTPLPSPPIHIRRHVLIWVGGAAALLLFVSVAAPRMRFGPMTLSGSSRLEDTPAAMSNSPSVAAPTSPSLDGSAAPQIQTSSQATVTSPDAPAVSDKTAQPQQVTGKATDQAAITREDFTPADLQQRQNGAHASPEVDAKRALDAPLSHGAAVSSARSFGLKGGSLRLRRQVGVATHSSHPQALPSDVSAAYGSSRAKQNVVLQRVGFDIDGYRCVTASGQRIDIPFKAGLNSVRFARAADRRMTLTEGIPSPVLSLRPADTLQNDAVPGSFWQPLPAGYSSLRPLYVRPAADWTQFMALRWYPNMNLVGGLASPEANDTSFVQLPGSYIRIGETFYPDFAAYRAYADAHPDALYLRPVYQLSATPVPVAAKRSGSAHGASRR